MRFGTSGWRGLLHDDFTVRNVACVTQGLVDTLLDPRIHAALVQGAMGSPPLRAEPYDAARLSEQLDDQCRRWINDPARNRARGDTLALSAILERHQADFAASPFGGVLGFVKAYAAPGGPIAELLARNPAPAIEWIPFDPAVNQAPRQPAARLTRQPTPTR